MGRVGLLREVVVVVEDHDQILIGDLILDLVKKILDQREVVVPVVIANLILERKDHHLEVNGILLVLGKVAQRISVSVEVLEGKSDSL